MIHSENDITTVIRWCSDILWKNDAQSVIIVSLTTQDINRDQYSNKTNHLTENLRIAKRIDCIDYYMSWAWSFYLREQSLLYRHKRIMSSCLCFEWSLRSFLSKMSEMSIMLIMLTVITSDSNDQSNHFKTLITQWLFNHCCYIISCKRVLTYWSNY